ncbi:MAG TPA: DUF1109 domain-containing protein [Rhizomicrobium sp.]|nr:DUF1109 domain-containing protein [Rhizomicrobium sp.]
MKTDELIALLGQDLKPARKGMVPRWLAPALAAGLLISLLMMLAMLGTRADLYQAMRLNAFWMKFFYTLSLAILGLILIERQARAGADSRAVFFALGAPVAAMTVLASAQLSQAHGDTAGLVMGRTWMVCPWLIALLSLPPLALLLAALRRLAPTRLTLAGSAAGLVAGAGAATVYGFHCTEMAAPFILIWYTLGIGLAAGLGAMLGQRCLHW